MGGDIQNTTDLQRDFDKVEGFSKRGYPCTARLNGINRDILRNNEGIWLNTYQCHNRRHLDLARRDIWFWQAYTGLPARAYPPYTAPSMHHAVKLWYGVDNQGKVGSTTVYPPSWIRVNSVRIRLLTQPYNLIGTKFTCNWTRQSCTYSLNYQVFCVHS